MARIMKSKIVKTLPILLAFISLSFVTLTNEQQEEKNNVVMTSIMQFVYSQHYSPLEIDNSLSEKVFDQYIKSLDYGKRYLLKSDYEKLAKYRHLIDDQLQSRSWDFFNLAFEIINERIKNIADVYEDMLDEPFDFTSDEEFTVDPDSGDYFKDRKSLEDFWYKSLKYDVMTRVANDLEIQEKAKEKKDTSVEIKSFEQLEKEAREKVAERYKNFFHRMGQLDRDDRFADFVNVILNVYDPHTGYFPPKDKEDFDIDISGKLEGIGALLSQRDEYIKVERVLPGSPSWKQGELENGDIILKVAQGSEEPVDVVDMRLDKAVRLIRGPKGTEVRLTVKKIDESIIIVPIIRDVVYKEETFAKSVVLQDDKGGPKLGYIKLPSFYVDFNNPNGRRSSDDMKKELNKLKDEKVAGIILDLRNNGGGSLSDAVDIGGHFITQGPIVQVNTKEGYPQILNDHNPEVTYDGPLVVMVNSSSASASEILAAALQDYGRAVIVGDSSSFGKGTVQRFYDLDRTLSPQNRDLAPLGALKMTMQKFYRINGGSTQLKGVKPDIILPSNYARMEFGEKEYDNVMPWDMVTPARYRKVNNLTENIKFLKERNEERMKTDSAFLLIDKNSIRLKKLRDNHTYTLNLKTYQKQIEDREKEGKIFEKIGKDSLDFTIFTPQDDVLAINSDTTKKAMNEDWHKNMRKDYYIFETMNILEDLIMSYQASMN